MAGKPRDRVRADNATGDQLRDRRTRATLQTFPEFEIRQYAAYTVAEVLVEAAASDAGNRAFPILAGYIFGKNKGERKLAMTAPVTQTAARP